MIRLTQVSTDSVGQVGAVGAEVSRLSKNYGVSSKELLGTAVTLKQANLSLADTKVALEALAQAALAPSFDNLKDTTEGAIAVMNQFGISAKDLGNALGAINAVAAEFAVEAQDLIEGVRKAGGAFKAAGGDLNEFLALFTSIRQTTRESAESIGTGLRTIFTRVQRNETVEALKEIGVQLRYTAEEARSAGDLGLTNQFIGPYEAVKRLSVALNELRSTDPRFSAIVEELGGYRQISKVIPLIQEFGVAQKALGVAQAGGASLALNAAQAQEAFGVKIQKVKEEFADFIRNLTNTSSFRSLIDLLLGAASAGIALADSLKGVLPVITAIAAVKTAQSLTGFAKGFGSTAFSPAPANQPSTFSPFLPTGNKKASGGIIKMAKGGIVPGVGRGDKVPALLEPGELVIPRNRFQYGGTVLDTIKKTGKVQLHDLYDTEAVKDNIEIVGEINRVQLGDYDKYREDSQRILNAGKTAYQKEMGKSNNVETATARANSAVSRAFGKKVVGGRSGFVPTLGEKYFQVPIGEGHSSQYNQIAGGLGEADTAIKIRKGGSNAGYEKLGNEQGLDFRSGKNLIETKVTKKQIPDKEIIAKALLYQASIAKTTYKQGKAETIFLNNLSVYESFKQPPIKMAIGGLVPGVGNTDSVPLDLPVGSYVVRKSAVEKIGSSNLSRLGRAGGGVIPALVMPGEYIYTPDETKKIGVSNLNHMNKTGRQKFGTGRFVAMNAMGVEVRDTVDAATEEEAEQKIRQMGYFVTEFQWIEPKKKRGSTKNIEPDEPRVDPYKDLNEKDAKIAKQIEGQLKIPTNMEERGQNEEQAIAKVKEINDSAKRVDELKRERTGAAGNVQRGLKKEESLTTTREKFTKDLDERQNILVKAKNEDEEARRIQKKHYDTAANYNRQAEALATKKLGAEASGDFAKSDSIQRRIDALKLKEERATARAVKKQETIDATTETRLLAEQNLAKTVKQIETIDKSIETNAKYIEENRKKEATAAKQEKKERKRFSSDKDGNVTERGKVITSTYGDLYKNEVQKELDNYKKLYGEEATGGSRKAVRENVSQRVKQGYFNQLKSFSEAKGLEFNEDFADKQAQQMARETTAGRRKFEVSDKGEYYDPALANRLKKEGYSETGVKGFRRKFSDFGKSIFTRENLQSNVFAASTGLGLVGSAIAPNAADAKKYVDNRDEKTYIDKSGGSGLFTGAAAGASIGTFGGVPGILIGALAGGITGLVTSLSEAKNQIADVKVEQSLEKLKLAFEVASNGIGQVSGEALLEIKNLQDIGQKEAEGKALRSTTYFSDFKAGLGTLTGLGGQGDKRGEYYSSLRGEEKRLYAGQAQGINSLVSKQIQEGVKSDKNFNAQDFLNSQDTLDQLVKLSIGLQQPLEKIKKQFETFAKDTLRQQNALNAQNEAVKAQQQVITSFSALASASNAAANTLNELSPSFKTIRDALFGGTSIGSVRRRSIDSESISTNPQKFLTSASEISSGLGGFGRDFQSSANVVSIISSSLPGILSQINPRDVGPGKDPQSAVSNALKETLKNRGVSEAESTRYVQIVVGKMGEDFTKLLNEAGGDFGEVSKRISENIASPLTKAYNTIAENLQKAADEYSKGLDQLINATLSTVQEYDKLSKIQQQSRNFQKNNEIENEIKRQKTQNPLGARFGEVKENQISLDMTNIPEQTQAFREQQSRLTGLNNGNELDPAQIQERIRQNRINTEAAETRRDRSRLTANASGRGDYTDSSNELARLKVEASLLNQAMKNLADSTEEVSAIEQRVGKIRQEIANEEQDNIRKQSETENRGEKLLTSSPEQLQRLQAGSQLTSIAKELGGNLLRFNVEQRKAIFEYLDFSGEEGKKLKSEFLQASGFVSKPETKAQDKYGPQLVQLNAQLFAAMAVREQAQSLIIKDQQSLQAAFFEKLGAQNAKFFSELEIQLSTLIAQQQGERKRSVDSNIKDLKGIEPGVAKFKELGINETNYGTILKRKTEIEQYLLQSEKVRGIENQQNAAGEQNFIKNIVGLSDRGTQTGRPIDQRDNVLINFKALENNLKNIPGLSGTGAETIAQNYQAGRANGSIGKSLDDTINFLRNEIRTQFNVEKDAAKIQQDKTAGKFGIVDGKNVSGGPLADIILKLQNPQLGVTAASFAQITNDIQRLGGFVGNNFFTQIATLQQQSNNAAQSLQNLNNQLLNLNNQNQQINPQAQVQPQAQPILVQQQERPNARNNYGIPLRPVPYNTGGMVTHSSAIVGADPTVFKPIGPDTIPAMLNHGEYVVNAKATAENLPLLQALNGGGTVKSTKAMNAGGPVNYLQDGGMGDLFAPLNVNRVEAQNIARMQRQQNVDIAILTKFGNLRGSWRRNALNNSLRILRGNADLSNVPYKDGILPISAVVARNGIAPWSRITDIDQTGLSKENLNQQQAAQLDQMIGNGLIYGMPLNIKQVPYQQILDASYDYINGDLTQAQMAANINNNFDPTAKDAQGNSKEYYRRRANLKPFFEDLLMAGSPPDITKINKEDYFQTTYGIKDTKNIKAIGFYKGGQAGRKTPAMLQSGEFVVDANTANKNKNLLDHMNGGGKVKYLNNGTEPTTSSYDFTPLYLAGVATAIGGSYVLGNRYDKFKKEKDLKIILGENYKNNKLSNREQLINQIIGNAKNNPKELIPKIIERNDLIAETMGEEKSAFKKELLSKIESEKLSQHLPKNVIKEYFPELEKAISEDSVKGGFFEKSKNLLQKGAGIASSVKDKIISMIPKRGNASAASANLESLNENDLIKILKDEKISTETKNLATDKLWEQYGYDKDKDGSKIKDPTRRKNIVIGRNAYDASGGNKPFKLSIAELETFGVANNPQNVNKQVIDPEIVRQQKVESNLKLEETRELKIKERNARLAIAIATVQERARLSNTRLTNIQIQAQAQAEANELFRQEARARAEARRLQRANGILPNNAGAPAGGRPVLPVVRPVAPVVPPVVAPVVQPVVPQVVPEPVKPIMVENKPPIVQEFKPPVVETKPVTTPIEPPKSTKPIPKVVPEVTPKVTPNKPVVVPPSSTKPPVTTGPVDWERKPSLFKPQADSINAPGVNLDGDLRRQAALEYIQDRINLIRENGSVSASQVNEADKRWKGFSQDELKSMDTDARNIVNIKDNKKAAAERLFRMKSIGNAKILGGINLATGVIGPHLLDIVANYLRNPAELRKVEALKEAGKATLTTGTTLAVLGTLAGYVPAVASFLPVLEPLMAPVLLESVSNLSNSIEGIAGDDEIAKTIKVWQKGFPDIASIYPAKGKERSFLQSLTPEGNEGANVNAEGLTLAGGALLGGGLIAGGVALPITAVAAGVGSLVVGAYKVALDAQAVGERKKRLGENLSVRRTLDKRFQRRGFDSIDADFMLNPEKKEYIDLQNNDPSTFATRFSDELEASVIPLETLTMNDRAKKGNWRDVAGTMITFPYFSANDAKTYEALEEYEKTISQTQGGRDNNVLNQNRLGFSSDFASEITDLEKSQANEQTLTSVRAKYLAKITKDDPLKRDPKTNQLTDTDIQEVMDENKKAAIFSRVAFKDEKNYPMLRSRLYELQKNKDPLYEEILNSLNADKIDLYKRIGKEKYVPEFSELIDGNTYPLDDSVIPKYENVWGVLPNNEPVEFAKSKIQAYKIAKSILENKLSEINKASNLDLTDDKKTYDNLSKKYFDDKSFISKWILKRDTYPEQWRKASQKEADFPILNEVITNVYPKYNFAKDFLNGNKDIFPKGYIEQYGEQEAKEKAFYVDKSGVANNTDLSKIPKEDLQKAAFKLFLGKKIQDADFKWGKILPTKVDAYYNRLPGEREREVYPTQKPWFKYDPRKESNKTDDMVSDRFLQPAREILFAAPNEPKPTAPEPLLAMASGGIVPSSAPNPDPSFFVAKGSDTVPAILSPGEYVVNARATAANLPLLQNLNSGGAVKYLYRGGDLQAINPYYARATNQSPGRGYIYSRGRQRTDFDIGSQGYLASKVYNPRSTANTFGNLANYAADRSGFLNKKYGSYTYNSEYSEKHSKEFGGSGSGWNSFTSRNAIPDYVRGFNAVSDSPYGSPKIAGRQKFAMEDWVFNDILNNREISRGPIGGYQMSNVGSRYISGLIGGPPADKVSLKDYMNELGFSKAGNQTFNGVSANKALAMGSLADTPGSNVGIAQQAISSIQTKGLGNLSVNNTDVAATTALDTIKNARMSHYNPQQPQNYGQRINVTNAPMNTPANRFRKSFFANGGSSTDTQPAMLTPGEFVVSKPAVDRVGTAFLDKVNNYAKGGKVGYYDGGGAVSPSSGSGSSSVGIDLKTLSFGLKSIQDAAVSTASGAVQLGTNLVQAAGTITSSISLIDKVGAIMNSSSASMFSSSLAFERAVNNLASALSLIPKTITLAIAPLSLNVSFNTPSVLAAIQQSLTGITTNVASMIDSAIKNNNNDQMNA